MFLPMWLCAQGTRSVTYNLAKPDSVYGATSSVDEKGMAKAIVGRLDMPAAAQTVKGHRVCLFMEKSQSARATAFEAEATFKQNYPDVPTYVIYDKTSYWKVLAGNCLTTDEATILKAKAEKLFPSKPFVVQEEIPLSELGKSGKDIASPQYLNSPHKSSAADTPATKAPATGM